MVLTAQTIILIPIVLHTSTNRPISSASGEGYTYLVSTISNSQVIRSLISRSFNSLLASRYHERETPNQTTMPTAQQGLRSLRRVHHSSHHLNQSTCSICQEDFSNSADPSHFVREMPCHHIFHEQCIVPWLNKSNTCPMCRLEIELKPAFLAQILEIRQIDSTNVIRQCGCCREDFVRNSNEEYIESGTITLIGCKHVFHTNCLGQLAMPEEVTSHSYVKCPTCHMEHLVKTSLLSPTSVLPTNSPSGDEQVIST